MTGKTFVLKTKRRWFRKPLVVVQIKNRFPIALPSSLAGEIFYSDATEYDIPEIQRRLDNRNE